MSSNLYQRVRAPREEDKKWNPTPNELLDHVIGRRIRNHQNVVAAVCGETGSGKSYTALKIGELVDPNFGPDSVVFSAKEFIETFESRPPGSVVIFDEGQEWNARRAMSKKNVEMSDILAMLRFTQVNIIFTSPNIKMVDVNLRRLMHCYINIDPIDRASAPPWLRTKSKGKLYLLRHPRRPGQGDEPIPALPVVPVIRDGMQRDIKVGWIYLETPSTALLESYEARKREVFRDRLATARANLGGPSPLPPVAPAVPSEEEDIDLGERR